MRLDDVSTRSQHQVKCNAQKNFSAGIPDRFGRHGLDRAVGAHGHEGWRLHTAAVKCERAAASLVISFQEFKLHQVSKAQIG